MRSEAGFQKIFAEASLLAEHHGIAVSSPRLSKGRSVYRPTVGVEGDCAETYYRINGHQQRVYSVASAVDSDCSRTAPRRCYGSTQQLQQRQVSKRLYRLLSILGTLPVTTCESERVFSKLQRTLTSIRSTMTEDRLEALLLLQCHREHCPTPDDVLSAFAKKARRLNFVL